jgi:hypothetical protein
MQNEVQAFLQYGLEMLMKFSTLLTLEVIPRSTILPRPKRHLGRTAFAAVTWRCKSRALSSTRLFLCLNPVPI